MLGFILEVVSLLGEPKMTASMTPALLDIARPTAHMRPGDVAPRLYPLPNPRANAQPESRPSAVWERYWKLPKTPLLVRGFIGPHRIEGTHHLDALLTECQLRSLDTVWGNAGRGASVIPLPLEPLVLVEVDCTPRRRPILPVWAATSFTPRRLGQVEALCLGHADTVRHLLGYMPEFMSYAVRWEVVELPIPESEARQMIARQRPAPSTDHWNWTVPYGYDWRNRRNESV